MAHLIRTLPHSACSALVILGLCLAVGCSGRMRAREPSDGGPPALGEANTIVDPSQSGDAPVAQEQDAGEPPALHVTLSAAESTLCPGQCTKLHAEVTHARGKLTVNWSNELGEARDVEFCPMQSGPVRVVVRDQSGGEELGHDERAEAQLWLSVGACAAEAKPTPAAEMDRVRCEARFKYRLPFFASYIGLPQQWATLSFWDRADVDTTPEGGAVFSGAFGGRINLGAGELRAGSQMNGFVHKVDADCKPVWTRALTAQVASDALFSINNAVDAQGNVIVSSVSGPIVDFSPHEYPLGFVSNLVLHKFSSTGELLFVKHFPAPIATSTFDIATDAAGFIYLTGIAHSYADFGRGALDIDPTLVHDFLLVLNAAGDVQNVRLNDGFNNIEGAAGQLWIEQMPPGPHTAEETLLELWMRPPLFDFRSLAAPGLTTQVELTKLWGPFAGRDNGGMAIAMQTASVDDPNEPEGGPPHFDLTLKRFDARGHQESSASINRSYPSPDPPPTNLLDASDGGIVIPMNSPSVPVPLRIATNAQDDVAIVGQLSSDVEIDGKRIEAIRANGSKYIIVMVDARNAVRWVYEAVWGLQSVAQDVAFSPDGDLFALGTAVQSSADSDGQAEQEIVLVKLRGAR